MFPVRYELNPYITYKRNSVYKELNLIWLSTNHRGATDNHQRFSMAQNRSHPVSKFVES
jgi:hypothetical protein